MVCSNRLANNNGMSIDEIKFAKSFVKSVVAVKITTNTSVQIISLGIDVIPYRKEGLKKWIDENK